MSVFNPQLFQDQARLARQSDDAAVIAWLANEERTPCLRDLVLAAGIGGVLTLLFSLIG
jgi:hypothetical protein